MDKVIGIKDLTLVYQGEKEEVTALENVSFDILRGEFVSVIGPSGCGKTTLLSVIAGLVSPTSGCVELNTACGENKVGYMFQRDCLFPWLTIEENCTLGAEIAKNKRASSLKYAEELLKNYGLWEFRKCFPADLSGGMRQRAALIRTLVVKPEILLLDEPFSALDCQARLAVSDDIYKIIKKEKKTALMVTHDISEAVSMSDRVIVLTRRPGRVKAVYNINFGPERLSPLKCREREEFKEYFNDVWRDIDVHI